MDQVQGPTLSASSCADSSAFSSAERCSSSLTALSSCMRHVPVTSATTPEALAGIDVAYRVNGAEQLREFRHLLALLLVGGDQTRRIALASRELRMDRISQIVAQAVAR